MNAKMLTILALSGLVAFGALSANAADGRDTSLATVRADTATVIEGRNATVDQSAALNESVAIRSQIEGNARSTH